MAMLDPVIIGDATLYCGDCLEVMRGMEADSVDAIVTDPPYGLEFMGKEWDHGCPGVSFWQTAIRVAKPGAHLLAFGGTRTFHRLACAIEDAGWEIRDTIMWVYGSGFPKSLDVSKAIDRMDASEDQERRRYRFTAWVVSQGITAKQINECLDASDMGRHYTDVPPNGKQPAIMTREHLEACRSLFLNVPEWVEREADIRSVDSRNMAKREIVGNGYRVRRESTVQIAGCSDGYYNITAPATPAASQWAGWGTALKPAWEPVIMARKPLQGTVAANVQRWGTGAINVDGCRIGMEPVQTNLYCAKRDMTSFHGSQAGNPYVSNTHAGRWPANVIHDGSDEVVGLFPVTASGKQAAGGHVSNSDKTRTAYGAFEGQRLEGDVLYGDSGSAARFFYCAKASKADRDEGCEGLEERQAGAMCKALTDGMRVDNRSGRTVMEAKAVKARNHHPTVKPTDLMRYLCRLVTPPGGIILDPFMGSGSTLKAALLENKTCIGIEMDLEYFAIAVERIKHVSPDGFTLESQS